MKKRVCAAAVLLFGLMAAETSGQTLLERRDIIANQFLEAELHHLKFHEDSFSLLDAIGKELFPLFTLPDVKFYDVSYPFVLPTTYMLVEWLDPQFQERCKDKMTITSGSRPQSMLLSNASAVSVHPTGMAVDIRVPPDRCLRWFRNTLISLREIGVVSFLREYYPPHFHVSVNPSRAAEFFAGE